jgi:hypothetical protein
MNTYNQARAIYADPKWKYYVYASRFAPMLFANKTSKPYTVNKRGVIKSFNVRKNSDGYQHYYYGKGMDNYLLNIPINTSQLPDNYFKPRKVGNDVTSFDFRQAARKVQNAAVKSIVKNYRAGRNLGRYNTRNILATMLRYQNPDSGPYYSAENNGMYRNEFNNAMTRNKLIDNFKNLNFNQEFIIPRYVLPNAAPQSVPNQLVNAFRNLGINNGPKNHLGRKIYTGPRGGQYILVNGRKVYKFTPA